MLKNQYVNDSKLMDLLYSLNKKERKSLGLWLNSDLHNRSVLVRKLFHGWLSNHAKAKEPIDKHTLLGYLGLSSDLSTNLIRPQDEKTLRDTMHKLTNQIQSFLIWNHQEKDQFSAKRNLMDVFLEKKLYKYIPQVLDKSQKELNNSPFRDIQYCKSAFELTEVEFFLSVLLKNRSSSTEIPELLDDLRQWCISQLLKYYCSAVSFEKILNVKYHYPLKAAILQHVAESKDRNVPVIWIYYGLIRMLEEGDPSHYYELKSYLWQHITAFHTFELRQFLNHIANYCNWMVKNGSVEFIQELHEVFKKGLELKCWSTGVYFSTHQFLQIVKNALLLHKVEWVDDFIQEHQQSLTPETRRKIPKYCFALKAFHLKDYHQAQDFLLGIQISEDFAYDLDLRILLIKIYFESDQLSLENLDDHPINYELEAMRQNVSSRNKKMSPNFRHSYSNFVKLFKRILIRKKKKLTGAQISSSNIQKLKQELHQLSPLVERDWLEQMLESIR